MKIILYGAGNTLRKFLLLQQEQNEIYTDQIVSIVDSDRKKWNTHVLNYAVNSPEIINNKEWDYIIVTSIYYTDIVNQLTDVYGINNEKIISVEQYMNEKMITFQITKNERLNSEKKLNVSEKFNLNSTVVYTTIFGDYDNLNDPLFIDQGFKYVCYTDNINLKSNIWEIRHVNIANNENIKLKVREYKILPHKLFPEYDTSIWIDANGVIRGSLRELMEKYQKYANILFMPHFARNCIYDEVATCIALYKDRKHILLQQMKDYLLNGYPENNGLLSGGFIVRNHNEKDVINAMEVWWDEVQHYSQRDQISLSYALWKTDTCYDLCPAYIYDNNWFTLKLHKGR